MNAVRQLHPDQRVLVTCMDESRFGLIPLKRRVWSHKGTRPIAPVRLKYEWVYLYSVVEPTSGDTFTMLWSHVNLSVMQYFLDAYAQTLPEDVVSVMVLDGAGWHSENGLKWPESIIPLKQPAYSPECNPTESLWDWIQDKLSVDLFSCRSALEARLIEIVNQLDEFKEELCSRLNYGWWNDAVIQI